MTDQHNRPPILSYATSEWPGFPERFQLLAEKFGAEDEAAPAAVMHEDNRVFRIAPRARPHVYAIVLTTAAIGVAIAMAAIVWSPPPDGAAIYVASIVLVTLAVALGWAQSHRLRQQPWLELDCHAGQLHLPRIGVHIRVIDVVRVQQVIARPDGAGVDSAPRAELQLVYMSASPDVATGRSEKTAWVMNAPPEGFESILTAVRNSIGVPVARACQEPDGTFTVTPLGSASS